MQRVEGKASRVSDASERSTAIGTEVVRYQPPEPPAIGFEELQRMGKAIAASGLFALKEPAQAIALMLVAQAEGRHPALAARDYDIIQGRPAKKTEAMQRDFLTGGGKIEWHELSDQRADATFSHPHGGSVRIAWDMARAQKAGLGGKDMWRRFPRQMLRSRVISEGIRTVFPMATSGMYVPEEVRDFDHPPMRDVTSARDEPARTDDVEPLKEELGAYDPSPDDFSGPPPDAPAKHKPGDGRDEGERPGAGFIPGDRWPLYDEQGEQIGEFESPVVWATEAEKHANKLKAPDEIDAFRSVNLRVAKSMRDAATPEAKQAINTLFAVLKQAVDTAGAGA